MKKILFAIIFVAIMPKTNAESIFGISWNFGSVGVGLNYSPEKYESIEITASAANIIFEQKDINIGLKINPAKYWYMLYSYGASDDDTKEDSKFSFINAALYWDLLRSKRLLLGPFASINYMYVNTSTGIDMKDFIFSGGLCFAITREYSEYFEHYKSQILSAEIGYRNIAGKNSVYFSVNADALLALFVIGSGIWYGSGMQYGQQGQHLRQ